MSGRVGGRKSRDGTVLDGAACFYDVGDFGQARSQDYGDADILPCNRTDMIRGLFS
jgi:hypothetical protein